MESGFEDDEGVLEDTEPNLTITLVDETVPDNSQFETFFNDLLVSESKDERIAASKVIIEQLQESAAANAPLIRDHFASCVRLANSCPYEEVRTAFKVFVDSLPSLDNTFRRVDPALLPGPSRFVPRSKLPAFSGPTAGHADADEDQAAHIFEDLFLTTGRLTNMERLFGWHPTFLKAFTITSHFIMRDDGPLPLPWRNYLAIMAAARYRCAYLVALHETEFIASGGDPAWLQGVSHTPKKLQALTELNAILAHQPWLASTDHIQRLVRDKGADSWSISELVHAFVILTTYQSLCGFIEGMGITSELDFADLSIYQRADSSAGHSPPHTPTSTAAATSEDKSEACQRFRDAEHLMQLLSTNVDASIPKPAPADRINPFLSAEADVDESKAEGPRPTPGTGTGPGAGPAPAGLGPAGPTPGPSLGPPGSAPAPSACDGAGTAAVAVAPLHRRLQGARPEMTRYLSSDKDSRIASMAYVPFGKANKVFFLHEYSWKEHAFALLNRYYQGLGPLLDKEFVTIYTLTYRTVSDAQGVDTTPFRRAIWYYTLRLYGMCHDDYNYNKIPIFLKDPVKQFVRKIVCSPLPGSVTPADYAIAGYQFKDSEKCHIALLAVEAHRQASLLYALHAVMRYMTSA